MYISCKAYLLYQVGVPSDRQQYIHRLGRTGRKGKEGQGILLLAPWETHFLNSVNDLSIAETVAPPVNPSIQAEVSSI
jgi:ATP-dependent RNA helicase MSS116